MHLYRIRVPSLECNSDNSEEVPGQPSLLHLNQTFLRGMGGTGLGGIFFFLTGFVWLSQSNSAFFCFSLKESIEETIVPFCSKGLLFDSDKGSPSQ
jgi:hypothetical protein